MKLSAFRNPKPIVALTLIALSSLIALALLAGAPNAQAQQPLDTPTPTPTPKTALDFTENLPADFPLPDRKPPLGNLDSMLSQIVERVEQGIATANSAAADAPISRGESVAVAFYMQSDSTSLTDFLSANGGDPRNIGERYVTAYVPVSLLVRASEQPGVVRVRAIWPPQPADDAPLSLDSKSAPSKGSVISQGVALHGADAWHAAGYTGAGVKVGIIDTNFTGFSALMGNDLPASAKVIARCYTGMGEFSSTLANCQSGDDNHGTVVAETLLDIAPDVTLYISNPLDLIDLKTTVDWLVREDVDVINVSLGWDWDGPGNGTSPYTYSPLRSVDAAVSGGAVWTGAAGNDARYTWFGAFTSHDSDEWLNFSPTDEGNTISLEAGKPVKIQLRWDDSWDFADTNMDLYLYKSGEISAGPVAISDDIQTGVLYDEPWERIIYPPTVGGKYTIFVKHVSGAIPEWMQLKVKDNIPAIEHYTENWSIANPAERSNPGMLAVGASHYWDTNTIASYSSRGPAPDGRTKPDIIGAACARVADDEPINLSNGQRCWFPGTSQSSPHVAGLARWSRTLSLRTRRSR